MSNTKMKIGVVGCGNISGIYFTNAKRFGNIEITACSDLDMEKARAAAKAHGVPKVCTVAELMADPSIDAVLNLTTPQGHVPINLQALNAGKHVYCEKPFALNMKDADKVLALAKKKGLSVGCAPDTFLGGGIQTCRQLIDDGAIGKPVAATAFMMCHGHESWHPDPAFYYKKGGGPMLDMGPYYLTALVNLLGPMKAISGATSITFPTRTITSQPKNGTIIDVETPTHLSGSIEFVNGAIATVIMSFDIWNAGLPPIQIHGSEGSLSVPDPNGFGGPIRLYKKDEKDWADIALTHIYGENSRIIGLADMLKAATDKRSSRASGELAAHVLEGMLAFEQSSKTGKKVKLKTSCKQPKLLPASLKEGELD